MFLKSKIETELRRKGLCAYPAQAAGQPAARPVQSDCLHGPGHGAQEKEPTAKTVNKLTICCIFPEKFVRFTEAKSCPTLLHSSTDLV